MQPAVVRLALLLILATPSSCATHSLGTVTATRYQVPVFDSILEFTHGHFHVITEIHVPDYGICVNLADNNRACPESR